MKKNNRFVGRLAVVCSLGAFLAQGAIAAPAQTGKRTHKSAQAERKSLHKQERAANTPIERTALRKQMKEIKKQEMAAKKSTHTAKRGGKKS